MRVTAVVAVLSILSVPSMPARSQVAPDGRDLQVEGQASYYSDHFQGKKTATGDAFSQGKMTAASPDLPLGSRAKVTNLENGKTVNVKINDRGPYTGGRVVDVSKSAARKLGIKKQGVAHVKVRVRASDQPTPKAAEKVREQVAAAGPAPAAPEPKKAEPKKAEPKKAGPKKAGPKKAGIE